MISKKNKGILSVALAGAMSLQMVAAGAVASAKVYDADGKIIDNTGKNVDKEVDNAYGDSTYADRFMSLYDDVVTRGIDNGYMSSKNVVSGGFGVPYHSAEEVICEAPDYGHETTSEAMSYLVWVAAMHDNIVNQNAGKYSGQSTGDLAKAWKTLEVMIPDFQGNGNGFLASNPSSTLSDEWPNVEDYPTDMVQGNNGVNPIHQYFRSAYGSTDKGLYLMHWLADVDDWYGFGAVKENTELSSFSFINTFQRGEQESCWETVPQGCVEMLKFGNSRGIKGIFTTEAQPAQQWAYTNAPDAEDRAIQAVYEANNWGVEDSSVTSLAAKMGDELRNDMFDKYYKEIGCRNRNAQSSITGQHYLMAWYTSWGGALDNSWSWQIGCSHSHMFYQNPLAAYALLADSGLNSGMKAQNATKDYKESLKRQVEMYEWLSSADGPIAGGCTNNYGGRYGDYVDKNGNAVNTFYDMAYVEHPVYADPGSNHWIGNQVWAVQRLAELYYDIKTNGDNSGVVLSDGSTIEQALKKVLDKWVAWFNDNTIIGTCDKTKSFSAKYEPNDTTETDFEIPDIENGTITDDGSSYSIPSSLIWSGQPETWTGAYTENSNLRATIVGYGSADVGCVSSLANTLFYYAKAEGANESAAEDSSVYRNGSASEADQALYIAKQLVDRVWKAGRDEIGVSIPDTNGSLTRFWETKVYIPDGVQTNGDGQVPANAYKSGTMPNGDKLENGVSFYDIRSNYKNISQYQKLRSYYETNGNTKDFELNYHRFWHEGDMMMALGTVNNLYPNFTPDNGSTPQEEEIELKVSPASIMVGEDATATATTTSGKSADVTLSTDSDAVKIDGMKITGVSEGTATITAKTADGKTATATIKVTAEKELEPTLLGDVDVDGDVDVSDVVLLNKYLVGSDTVTAQGLANAKCYVDDVIDSKDAAAILKATSGEKKQSDLPLSEI